MRIKNLLSIFLRLLKLFILVALVLLILTFQLEIDRYYGIFEWIESPSYNPFRDALYIFFSSFTLWLLSKRFVLYATLKNPASKNYTLVFDIIQKIYIFVWVILIILIPVFLIQNPPTNVLEKKQVKILRIYQLPNQSKPYKTSYKVSSWRGKEYETLSTHILEYKDAKKLKEQDFVLLSIGIDWLGRTRVLRVEPIKLSD